jgi:hypothetical protein
MPDITEPPSEPPWAVRLAWFFGIAIASAGVIAAIAYALRALLR